MRGSGTGPREPAPPADVEAERRRWREQALTALLWAMAVVIGLAGLGAAVTSGLRVLAAVVVVVVVVVAAAAQMPHLGYGVRVALLLGGTYVGVLTAYIQIGLGPNTAVVLCMLVVMTTLLLGRTWGFAVVVLAAASLLGGALLHHAGVLVPHGPMTFPPPPAPFLARVIFVFVAMSSVCVLSVSYLLDQTESLLDEKASALHRLEREHAEKERIHEDLQRHDAALQKARELEVLGRLASSVAHDFNNALLIIQASADLARHKVSLVDSAMREISAAVEQAAATTRQLRAFGPQAPRPPKTLALDAVVSRAAHLLERVLPSNIALDVSAAATPFVRADEGQIQSILTNLALNARDAMPEGGSLSLRVRAASAEEVRASGLDGAFAAIDVEDTGSGMSEETLGRVFEPFFSTKGAAGTGLGLASVKEVVEKHGGGLGVASTVGKGTTFHVYLPLHEGAVEAESEEPTEMVRGTATVLFVDDDDAVRRVMTQTLTLRGFRVLEATNASDALLVARRYRDRIHVLCTDCVMPGIPVRQLIEGFRATHPKASVILCSSYGPEELGAPVQLVDAFLPKPFSPDTLATAVTGIGAASGSMPPPRSDDLTDKLRGARVLVVDDSGINRDATRAILEAAGASVGVAASGREATESASAYDAVLMDVEMPEMDGCEATRILRARDVTRDVPVIAMSGHVLDTEKQRCSDAGMNDYLAKPFDALKLVDTVAKWAARGGATAR